MYCVPVGCMFSETAGGRHETRLANAMWTMSTHCNISHEGCGARSLSKTAVVCGNSAVRLISQYA